MTKTNKSESQPAILVVEDEAMLLMIVAETLLDAGYAVWEAENGERALSILGTKPEIDLLITDIRMPGIDGYQVADRGLTMRPGLKVLLMTGYAQEPLPSKHAGIPILYKPFDINKLPVIVDQMLN